MCHLLVKEDFLDLPGDPAAKSLWMDNLYIQVWPAPLPCCAPRTQVTSQAP